MLIFLRWIKCACLSALNVKKKVFFFLKVITPSSFWKLYFQEYFHFPVIISIFNLVPSDGWARGGSDREARLSKTQKSLARRTFREKKIESTVGGNSGVLFNLHS